MTPEDERIFIEEFSQLEPEVITVSDEDFEKMLEAIENPPEPSTKLVKVLKGRPVGESGTITLGYNKEIVK